MAKLFIQKTHMEQATPRPNLDRGPNDSPPPRRLLKWRKWVLVAAAFGLMGIYFYHAFSPDERKLSYAEMIEFAKAGRIHPEGFKIVVKSDSESDEFRGILLKKAGDPAESGTPFCTTIYRSGGNKLLLSDLQGIGLFPVFEEESSHIRNAVARCKAWLGW